MCTNMVECKYTCIRMSVQECVRVSSKLQGQCVGSVLTESHVCKALFHLCSLFFLLFEVAWGCMHSSLMLAFHLFIYCVDWSEVRLMSCDLKAMLHFVLLRTGQNVLNHWRFAPIREHVRKTSLSFSRLRLSFGFSSLSFRLQLR